MLYSESQDVGNNHRIRFMDQIHATVASRKAQVDARRSEYFRPDISSSEAYQLSLGPYRDRFRRLLGWPLTGDYDGTPEIRQEYVAEDELGRIFRVWIRALPEIEAYGLLFE